jgi:hypothetical protein
MKIEKMAETKTLLSSVLKEVEPFLLTEDLELLYEFLTHDKLGLAIEFMCDKLYEYRSILSETLGKKLQVLSGYMGLHPARSWEGVIVFNTAYQQPAVMIRDLPDFGGAITSIYDAVKGHLEMKDSEQIKEFIEVDEFELAIDMLCGCLKVDKIPISIELLNKIRTVLLDLDMDPEKWNDLIINTH